MESKILRWHSRKLRQTKAVISLLNESVRDIIALILFEFGYETAAEMCDVWAAMYFDSYSRGFKLHDSHILNETFIIRGRVCLLSETVPSTDIMSGTSSLCSNLSLPWIMQNILIFLFPVVQL